VQTSKNRPNDHTPFEGDYHDNPACLRRRPDLSVVIVNWNTKSMLRDCLVSLFRSGVNAALEVFVVDNGSSDGSPDMVEAEFPSVKLIRNDRNMGFAAANNQALRLATGRHAAAQFRHARPSGRDRRIGRLHGPQSACRRHGLPGPQCRRHGADHLQPFPDTHQSRPPHDGTVQGAGPSSGEALPDG
jgi:hypothetical protein